MRHGIWGAFCREGQVGMTSIRKWVERLLTPGGRLEQALYLGVRCNRCGEVIKARVDLRNALSLLDEGEHGPAEYYCRKILVGQSGCFQRIEVELFFDSNRALIEQKISGGQFTEV